MYFEIITARCCIATLFYLTIGLYEATCRYACTAVHACIYVATQNWILTPNFRSGLGVTLQAAAILYIKDGDKKNS